MRNEFDFRIFLIPFNLILIGVALTLVSSQCQSDQRSSLIQLKNSLRFNPSLSTKLVSWNLNSSKDCCSWGGVTCSGIGRVIGLDLSNESISAGINDDDDSSVLFDLVDLQRLNLAANKFNFTQITSRFGNLTSLTYLNLSNSDFSGQIPGEISKMTKLEILDLSSIFFYKTRSLKLEEPNLAVLVRNLTRLTDVYLDNVNISAQRLDWCQVLSSSLPNLKVLSLSRCYLSGPIDESLKNLQSLSVVRLSGNNLSTPVPDFFADFMNLTILNLGSCELIRTFPKRVLELPSLQILDLSTNGNLHGSLPDFPVNRSLQRLVLSNTNFSGKLPESIGDLKMLSRLELPKNGFSGRIPKSMENLTRLSYLDLSSNNFTGTIPSFQQCKNLTHIDLSRNGLSGLIPSAHFEDLQNLVLVDLGLNALSGSIPSSLFSLPQVESIKLSNNNFDGQLPNFANASASLLKTLDLSINKLERSIPSSFFELRRLSILLLSSNNLSGVIQGEDFLGLSNLTTLDLSYNNLSIETRGRYPIMSLPQLTTLRLTSCNLQKFPDLRNQSRLMKLDLSDNQIGGEIPKWIWTATNGNLSYMNLSHNQLVGLEKPYVFHNLTVLDLHSNKLSGVIPIPPKTATYVDYSDNNFSSLIPNSIGNNLTYAYFFSVSKNKLTGPIPETVCNAIYLQVLDLSDNSLNGTIPRCLIEWNGTLGVLNLGKNNLSGRINGTFLSSCGLNTLDLHGNSLEGKFPKSVANCTALEELNLGNNRISDTYPCSLRNNTNLRVLVIRSNRFYGRVDCGSGESNIWEKLQIIDIALNTFTGPVPTDCFWNWRAMMTNEDGARPDTKHLNFQMLWEFYYQDTVTVTVKGLELELVKILTPFTSIDISSNCFEGRIPSNVGQFTALIFLNVSHNDFTGSIPASIGNLSGLESLDLSGNKLNGEIPQALTGLTFLSYFNLSHNQLQGRIPSGTQLQSFSDASYEGNTGLCGSPLTACSVSPIPTTLPNSEESGNEYDWKSIFTGLGFGVGAAITLAPLALCKQGRDCWDKHTNKLLAMMCLAFGIKYAYDAPYREEEVDEKETLDDDEDTDESECELELEGGIEFKGRYCVFCTKLDFTRKKVIHNPQCTCFHSTPVLYSSSLSSSSAAESPFSKL